jgi:hypothetical protein
VGERQNVVRRSAAMTTGMRAMESAAGEGAGSEVIRRCSDRKILAKLFI